MSKKDSAYDDTEIAEQLRTVPGWYCEAGLLCRMYKTDGWPTTLMLVNTIGYLAEAADHHPDVELAYSRVVVKLSTHSAGGITAKDFELARRIEDVALWRPSGGALTGTTGEFVRGANPG